MVYLLLRVTAWWPNEPLPGRRQSGATKPTNTRLQESLQLFSTLLYSFYTHFTPI